MSSPIACVLANLSPEQRRREQTLLRELQALGLELEETADGYRSTLPEHALGWIGEWIALERLCCPFLAFTLSAPAEQEPARLTISGREGVKEFLRSILGHLPRG